MSCPVVVKLNVDVRETDSHYLVGCPFENKIHSWRQDKGGIRLDLIERFY